MVNDCIEIGISYDAASLKRLSVLSWPQRRKYDCPSYYKASAVSRAAGILASRKKSLRRGIPTKNPYSLRPQITAYQGFRVKDGTLRVPIGKRSFEYVPLTSHTASILLDPAVMVRSFTLTPTSLSLCISKEVPEVECTEGIRRLYRKGNGQNKKYRGRMNGWSFWEAQRQIEYKARWVGLPVVRLSRRETRGSSLSCPRCGERLQSDKKLRRKLWCGECRMVMDRDVVAAINLSRRGRVRFARSRPPIVREAQGGAAEAVKGNPTPTVILRADALKSSQDARSGATEDLTEPSDTFF